MSSFYWNLRAPVPAHFYRIELQIKVQETLRHWCIYTFTKRDFSIEKKCNDAQKSFVTSDFWIFSFRVNQEKKIHNSKKILSFVVSYFGFHFSRRLRRNILMFKKIRTSMTSVWIFIGRTTPILINIHEYVNVLWTLDLYDYLSTDDVISVKNRAP